MVATESSRPLCKRDLREPEGRGADGGQGVHVPVAEDRRHAVAEQVDGRLGERRGESEEHARGGSEECGARRRPGAQGDQQDGDADARRDPAGDQPIGDRRVVVAARRVDQREEGDEAARDEQRAGDLAPPDALARQVGAQRQREHDADDLDRLHNDQASEAERSCLHREPGQHDRDAEQPQRPLREARQEPRGELGVGGPAHAALLLEDRAERVQEGRAECQQDGCHGGPHYPVSLAGRQGVRETRAGGPIKILYGVIGEGLGHATRSRVVAEHLMRQGHEVKAAASGRAFPYLSQFLPDVEEIWGLEFALKHGQVDAWRTLRTNARKGLRGVPSDWRRGVDLARRFGPELVVTDFEGFAYLFAKTHRLPVISIDNIQMVDRCRHAPSVLAGFRRDYLASRAFIGAKLPRADHYVITTFFWPPPRKPRTSLVPSLLRDEVLAATPEPGEHLLVYGRISETAEAALKASRRAHAHLRRP